MALIQPGQQVYTANQTISFVSAGVTAANVAKIYLIELDLLSVYDPNQLVNQIYGFEAGKDYWIVALQSFQCAALGLTGGSVLVDEDGTALQAG